VPDLDPREREELAADVVDSLEHALLGSLPTLRDSLALGRAHAYSDIDVLWQVQEGSLMLTLEALPRALEAVRPIESSTEPRQIAPILTAFSQFIGGI